MTDIDFIAESQAMKRMKEIDDRLDIDNMLKVQELTDIEKVYCIDSSLGIKMRRNIITKFTEQCKSITKEQKDELLHGKNIRVSRNAIIPYFRDQLCANVEDIDWDKFLLISAYRARTILLKRSNTTMTQEQVATLKKITQTALDLIGDKSVAISAELDFDIGKTQHVQYSFEELLRDLRQVLESDTNEETIQLKKWKDEISKNVSGTEGR